MPPTHAFDRLKSRPDPAPAAFVLAVAGVCLAMHAHAQECLYRHSVQEQTPNTAAVFGFSVAIGDPAGLIGSPGQNCAHYFPGPMGNGTRLVPDDVPCCQRTSFGSAVAVAGTTFLIGAPLDDEGGSDAGAAYIFEYNESQFWWYQTAKLIAADADAADQFGFSVAASDGLALVGAPRDEEFGVDAGAVYVFERLADAWVQTLKLTPEDVEAGDRFGHRMALSGHRLIVSSLGDDDNGEDSGSAYVFERGAAGWMQIAKLTPDDGAAGDQFGAAVAIHDDVAVIGAPGDDQRGDRAGAAHVFERLGGLWSQTARLTAGNAAANDLFGTSVAVHGDRLAVGAPYHWLDLPTIRAGAGYLFIRAGAGWEQRAELAPPYPSGVDQFGYSAAMSDDQLIMGAPYQFLGDDRDPRPSAGTCTVFQLDREAQAPRIGAGSPIVRFCNEDWVTLFAAAAGDEPLRYQWYYDGAALMDGDVPGVGYVKGSRRSTLSIYPVDQGATGSFSVRVYNYCGLVESPDATLSINSGDVNGDGRVNLADLSILLSRFGSRDATLTDGDLTGDGVVDLADLAVMLTAYGSPCW